MRAFEPTDLSELGAWAEMWGCTLPATNDFPIIGFIEPGVAAGFLVRAEGTCCFLDGYINNPMAPKGQRKQSEIEITDKLLNIAKGMGYKKVFVITQNKFISHRAKKNFGFRDSQAEVLIGEI